MVQVEGRINLLEFSCIEHANPRSHRHGFDLIVGHVNEGCTKALMQLADERTRFDAQLGIQVGQRLVHQKYGWFAHDSPAYRHPLTLTAGKLAGTAVKEVFDAKTLGRFTHALVNNVLRGLAQAQTESHVVVHSHVRVERIALKHHRHVAIFRGDVVDNPITDENLAFSDLFQPSQHPQTGGLPTAGRADEHEKLFVRDLDVKVLDDCVVAETFVNVTVGYTCHRETSWKDIVRTKVLSKFVEIAQQFCLRKTVIFISQLYCLLCKKQEISLQIGGEILGEIRSRSANMMVNMTQNVNAEIIAIGTELLLGEITDTNSVHIARTLRDIGVNLYFMTSVGDNEQRIADAIRIALSRAQVVITCGGLGPTVDDVTRQAVAAATERGLTFHQDLLDKIAERFAGFRVQMTENNRRQAYLPDDAIVIENPVGTAPSFIVEYGDKVVISLPGVPREMRYLLAERVVPYLRERYDLGSGVIKARVLRTAGIGESALDTAIGDDLLQASNPTVGLAAHAGQVDVRITAKADSLEVANRMIAEVEAQLRQRIGPYIFGVDEEQIEEVLTRALEERQMRLAISETGIGGAISERLKTASLANRVLTRSEMHASPDDLRRALAINGVVSLRELAERAAEAASKASNAAVGIAVVSHPDMDEHHADREEGTAIAVYLDGNLRSRAYGFGGQAETAKSWASTWAMSMAWRMLKEAFHDDQPG